MCPLLGSLRILLSALVTPRNMKMHCPFRTRSQNDPALLASELEAYKGWLNCGELKLAELLEVAPEEEESDDDWGYKGVLPPLFLRCT